MSQAHGTIKPGHIQIHIEEFTDMIKEIQGCADLLTGIEIAIRGGVYERPMEGMEIISSKLYKIANEKTASYELGIESR